MDTIVLRKVFALDPTTGKFLIPGQILVTDGIGGTYWSTTGIIGNETVGFLPSTISTMSSLVYVNTINYINLSSAVSTLSSIVSEQITNPVTKDQLVSSVAGIGTGGYVSTADLQASLASTVAGLGKSDYLSTADLQVSLASTVAGLGTSRYVSSLGLQVSIASTVAGLGTAGYISTLNLGTSIASTVIGLGTSDYVSTSQLVSTVRGLGSARYVSSSQVASTVAGLGSVLGNQGGYISTATLSSVTLWLQQNAQYNPDPVTTASLVSSVKGLGSVDYVSTASLVSTTASLADLKQNFRFDTVTSATVVNSIVSFCNAQNVIYISTFLQSSIPFAGNTNGVQIGGSQPRDNDFLFSTASINMSPFSSFINSNSRITLDVYPTFAFSKLGTGASQVGIFPISTVIQYGQNILPLPSVTGYLYAGNTQTYLENGSVVDASNIFNSPMKLVLPAGTTTNRYTSSYTLVHYMPSSIQRDTFQNGLHSTIVAPYYSPRDSIFVSIQNIQ